MKAGPVLDRRIFAPRETSDRWRQFLPEDVKLLSMTISLISHPFAPVEVLLSNLDIPEIVLNEKINVFAMGSVKC